LEGSGFSEQRWTPLDHVYWWANAPLIINGNLGTDLAGAIIVESEFDALLLCQELRNQFTIIATGSTSNGPSAALIEILRHRSFVLIALDNDEAGAKAAWRRWMALKNAIRAPIPASWGKDHTEAHLNGHNLNWWMEAAYGIVIKSNTEE
jgi:DNA primase